MTLPKAALGWGQLVHFLQTQAPQASKRSDVFSTPYGTEAAFLKPHPNSGLKAALYLKDLSDQHGQPLFVINYQVGAPSMASPEMVPAISREGEALELPFAEQDPFWLLGTDGLVNRVYWEGGQYHNNSYWLSQGLLDILQLREQHSGVIPDNIPNREILPLLEGLAHFVDVMPANENALRQGPTALHVSAYQFLYARQLFDQIEGAKPWDVLQCALRFGLHGRFSVEDLMDVETFRKLGLFGAQDELASQIRKLVRAKMLPDGPFG